MSLFLAVLTPFLGAPLVAYLALHSRARAAWAAGGVAVLALAQLLPAFALGLSGATSIERFVWIPTAGLDLAFRLDGLSLLFAGLILGIGLLVILYALYYLSERDSLGRLYAYLLLFMGSMLGVVLSENLIQLLIFWELTSLSSFLLIGYWRYRQDARTGARMALAITGAGGLALLGGILLLGEIVGSYELSAVLAAGDLIRGHELYRPTLVLILLGAFAKSAQFPLHFWLPHAMAAPTPVSAYLHSATMVKAGVFLLARLFPALSGTWEWTLLVGGIGLATLLVGAVIALFKHDLKGLLAYSTISHLGLITALFGIGTPLAAVAGVFHIINHATFKAGLFMAAGIIDHECGTRDMRRINGLWKYMPYTATLAMVAAAAMAGVPLFNGFLSKEMFFAEAVDLADSMSFGWLLPAAVTFAGIFAVAYSLRFIHDVFFNGDPIDLPKTPHEPPRWMKVPVEILVALCLLVGILPALTVAPLLSLVAAAVLQAPPPEFDLALWHGFSPALWMSVIALAGGTLLYAARKPLFAWQARNEGRLDAKRIYERLLGILLAAAVGITRALDNASLQRMLVVFMLAALGLGLAGWLGSGSPLSGARASLPVDPVSGLAALAMVIATVATVALHRQRFVALLLVGSVGLLVSLTFIKFSAPDLALTQLSVEVVTIILLLLALYFLPHYSPVESSVARRLRDAGIAGLAGLGVAALAWAVLSRPFSSISGYYLTHSVPGGGGGNVVNVILVDFRGFDTLGEITVLALAGLAIYAMLIDLRLQGHPRDADGRAWDGDLHPAIMASLTRLLLPLALLVSVFILLRGHNLPGGGFIAGLVTAVALIMQYLANGVAWTHARLPANMHPAIAAGLGIATLTGLASFYFDHPFLTSTFGHLHWPLVGDIHLASAMAFDLGVYLVVVGATLLILIHLGLMHNASHDAAATASGEAR
ncbi:MAG: monovalent cation/H+ antiporter subunit A [Thiobacillaceae bacterium]|jgi:multicomponent K+:H+ antiporter subunit A|nr:monovalent cation/H+ antiporter subunit A [Thiobacillaceae bacterium]